MQLRIGLEMTLTRNMNMALRNAKNATAPVPTGPTAAAPATAPAAAQVTAPAFETEEPAANEATVSVIDTPAAGPSVTAPLTSATSTALTKPTGTALGASLSSNTALKGLQNAIGLQDLEALGFGVFPRITVGLDGFSIDKDKELGKKIKFEVLSWNYVWMVTTGEQNNDEANKLIRTSYNGVNIKGEGRTVEEYVKHLRDVEGYDKTSVKQYIEVYCNLVWSETKGEVAPESQQIHQLSLSPQSVAQWGRYLLETGMRKVRGIEDTNIVFATQERKIIGANKFGVAHFSAR